LGLALAITHLAEKQYQYAVSWGCCFYADSHGSRRYVGSKEICY
jgi:hypothetical protein